ncbi:hypothetical protein RB195_024249 [Necator americanus]|uniref:Uncharacterized protein n=1 Tax=Necator americanus TaxID=51031 RepID=A0ABR1EME3_NECAM
MIIACAAGNEEERQHKGHQFVPHYKLQIAQNKIFSKLLPFQRDLFEHILKKIREICLVRLSGAGAPILCRGTLRTPSYTNVASVHQCDAVGAISPHLLPSGVCDPIRRRGTRPIPLGSFLASAHKFDAIGAISPHLLPSGVCDPIRRRGTRPIPLGSFLASAHKFDAMGAVSPPLASFWGRRINTTP